MKAPLALADLHLDLLYERDDAGYMLRSRDPDVPLPLLHLVRTVQGNRWLLSAALTLEVRAVLEAALRVEPVVPDLAAMEHQPPDVFALAIGLGLGDDSSVYCGPAYSFGTAVVAPAQVPIELLPDAPETRTLPALAWIRDTSAREQPLCIARNGDGLVVAVCHSARSTPAGAEAGVETVEAYRGRGLAGAVVAGWARAVQAQGRLPLYSTLWSNHASRSVARKLALIPYGESGHLS